MNAMYTMTDCSSPADCLPEQAITDMAPQHRRFQPDASCCEPDIARAACLFHAAAVSVMDTRASKQHTSVLMQMHNPNSRKWFSCSLPLSEPMWSPQQLGS